MAAVTVLLLGPFVLSCLVAVILKICVFVVVRNSCLRAALFWPSIWVEDGGRSKVLHAAHPHVRHLSAAAFNLGSLSRPAFRVRKEKEQPQKVAM